MPDRNITLHIATRAEIAQLRATGRAVATFADGTIGHFRRLSSHVLNLRSLLAGGIFGATVNKLTTEGDEVDKLSQRLSVSAEEFQVLRHAMELGGSSGQALETVFRTLTRRVFDLASGSTEGADELAALGLTLADLQGKSPIEQFKTTFQALGQIEDAASRSAVAQSMFGRSGLALLPVLNSTGGSLDSLADKMKRNGQLLTTEQIAKSAKFRDSLTDLNRVIQASLFDILEEQIGDISKAIDELVASGKLKTWGRDAAAAVHAVYSALKDLADFIGRNRETIQTLGISYVVFRVLASATAAVRALKVELAAAAGAAGGLNVAVGTIGTGVATAGIAYLLSLIIQIGNEARKTTQAIRDIEADGTIGTGRLADHARRGAVGQFFGTLGEVLRHGPGGDPNAMQIRTSAPGRAQIATAKPRAGAPAAPAAPAAAAAPDAPPAAMAAAARAAEDLAAAKLRLRDATNAYELAVMQEAEVWQAEEFDRRVRADMDARQDAVDQARRLADELEQVARDAERAAQDAWNALLNPATKADQRAARDAEREQQKLERHLAKARARQAAGDPVSKRGRELIAADDMRQAAEQAAIRAAQARDEQAGQEGLLAQAQQALAAATQGVADAMPRVLTESEQLAASMANLRKEISALQVQAAAPVLPGLPAIPGVPSLPSVPSTPGSGNNIAADIAAIRQNTAKLLDQGLL